MPPASKSDMHRSDPSEGDDRRPSDKPVSATLVCGECEAINPSTHRFCTACGSSLSEACPHCGEKSFSGEKFCGSCGVNVALAAQQAIEQFEANLSTIEQMRAAQRYDEALALLEPMSKAAHSRLARFAGRASQLVRLVSAERERGRLNAETAYEEAQRLLAAQQIDRAAEVLEAVPPSLRGESLKSLLHDVADRRAEVSRLSDSLRTALAENRAAEALVSLARLLELRPEDVRTRRLADQLQEKYCRAAERKMASGRHKDALRLLEEVPPSLAVGPVGDRFNRIAEWAALAHGLRTAPVIDAAVLSMAERLRVIAPNDADSGRLIEEILKRSKRAVEAGSTDLPSLAAAPPQTPLGFPIDFLPPFRRITPAEKIDRQWLASHRGQLAVACGLALQGLEKAEVAINLLPGARHRALSSFAQKLLKPAATWGIDLGSTSVKAVRLAWNPKDRVAVLEAAECLEYRKPMAQAANADEQATMINEVLTDLLSRHRLRGSRVCLGLPGRITMLQRMRLPAAEPVKLAAMIRHEAPRYLPLSLDKLVWAYHIMESGPSTVSAVDKTVSGAAMGKMVPVHFCAARTNLVEPRVEALTRNGIHVEMVQSEYFALHNLWVFENTVEPEPGKGERGKSVAEVKRPQPESDPLAVALLDVGGETSNLVISSRQGVWARPLNFGGHISTRTLVKELNLTYTLAEQFKRNPSQAPGVYLYGRTIGPALADLYHDVEQCLEAFAHSEQQEPIGRMFGLGGEFQLHGMLRHLRTGTAERSAGTERAALAGVR